MNSKAVSGAEVKIGQLPRNQESGRRKRKEAGKLKRAPHNERSKRREWWRGRLSKWKNLQDVLKAAFAGGGGEGVTIRPCPTTLPYVSM